jgi:transcriptional regulator with XRE-family HTH domain
LNEAGIAARPLDKELDMITGAQCHAARALVEITVSKLARRSGVDRHAVEAFEQKRGKPDAAAVAKLKQTLEALGTVFIEENGGGVGVRLRHTRSETKQISRMEDEGGLPSGHTAP